MNQVSDSPMSKTDPELEILQQLDKIAETGNKFREQVLELGEKLKSFRKAGDQNTLELQGPSKSPDWMKSVEAKLQEMAKTQHKMSANIGELEKQRFNLQEVMAGKLEDVLKDVATLKSLTETTRELKPKLNEGTKLIRDLESKVEKMTRDFQGDLDLWDSNIKSNENSFTASLKKFGLLTPEALTDADGWIVIQRRDSGPPDDFERGWIEYENGFGSVDRNFWLGLKKIHELTADSSMELQIDLTDWKGNSVHADYSKFSISNADDLYRLTVSGCSGTAGDSLQYENGSQFSTSDKKTGEYAEELKGGWWKNTRATNMNGLYREEKGAKAKGVHDFTGVHWCAWKGPDNSLQKVVMKIRKRK